MLTMTDGFCGAGGSDQGAEMVPGVVSRYAINHWQAALDTHNENMPHVNHLRADLSGAGQDGGFDPRHIESTDLAWFSPECTTWSQARGKRVDYDVRATQPSLWDDEDTTPAADESVQRSRFQMETVVAFVRVHQYRAFIVENVPDILKWWDLPRWLRELVAEDYDYKILHLNSAFAAVLGAPAPQLRNRAYFAFWKKCYPRPDFDKWLRPRAWCPTCETDVAAMFSANTGPVRPMHYGRQYHYRCPTVSCRGSKVLPYALPAAAAIDWTLPGERIADRARPLADKTLARIRAGLARYGQPIHLEAAGNTFERRPGVRSWPITEPLRTVHTTASKAIAYDAAMLVPAGGTRRRDASSVTNPMPTRTTTENDALVVPLRNNGLARDADTAPLMTVAAGGEHHALVMRNQNSRGGQMCTPLNEPFRTVTASCLQSVVRWDHLLFPYDARGTLRTLDRPLPTQTTVEGDAVLGTAVAVEDCTFRMLDVHEIKAGSAFPDGFLMPYGSRRDRVRMLGNAVTPNAARDLIGMLVEAITGEDIAA